MQMSVTFRHMDATDALRNYAQEKLDRIRKYFPDPIKAHVVLDCERGYNHLAEVVITLQTGLVIAGEETTEDMYSSIDLVMAKIERQVRRYKEKIRSHKGGESIHGHREFSHKVVQLDEAEGDQASANDNASGRSAGGDVKIIRESSFVAKPMTPEEAVMQMNLRSNDFLVFSNAVTHDVNVVYRRGDGTYGLIETGKGAAQA
jgi:putative sigma-54 modulation protein